MSATTGEPPAEAKPQSSEQPQNAPANPQAPPQNGDAPAKSENVAASTGPALTPAQIKAKNKADKQARRAQVKATKEVAPAPPSAGPSGHPTTDSKGNKAKGKPDSAPSASSGATNRTTGSKGSVPAAPAKPESSVPECFSHLSIAKRLPITQADKDVHPTVLTLGQKMATFSIDESIARLKATLLAFKKVIDSYTTPPGNTLARHLTPHVLNPQIEYLSACRPMCFSMGNAIRWLKLQVSTIDPDVPEADAKKDLCAGIDAFIQERINFAEVVITQRAADCIQDGDVVLVYGRNTLVERTLFRAHLVDGKKFDVIVVDDPYKRQGQVLAKVLTEQGIKVSYSGDFGGLRSQVALADSIFLGAEGMFSNGALYSPCGTSDVAIAAKDSGKPVYALCESINITDRVSTDSLTYNEIDPERCTGASFRLLYDTTPSHYLTTVVTEISSAQPTSVSYLLRKLEDSN
ncbi:putative translation initiation factor eif-2b subunit delta [Rosellinia necatrix]|uniref:Translation initiation factor eIF2B subunit delta n=1 Tax=Rosellinia necatrix TaxID=77044 RepID=A0A1W2TSB4_ROSNE|nr:putative translation initiation factor eif-2b subunit delta [Rosellinia necatrix]